MFNHIILAITPLKINTPIILFGEEGGYVCLILIQRKLTKPLMCFQPPTLSLRLLGLFFFSDILKELALFFSPPYLVLHYVFQELIIIITILNEYFNI
jgi:hypothetical protein